MTFLVGLPSKIAFYSLRWVLVKMVDKYGGVSQNRSLPDIVWKFHDYSVTPILREINFGEDSVSTSSEQIFA